MNFTMDLKDISFAARAVVYFLAYLGGLLDGLRILLASLIRMAWEITWPVAHRVVYRVWPEFDASALGQERNPWCAVSYSSYWASKKDPFEVQRSDVDLYVITWRGWQVDLFTSARVDRLISRWVPSVRPLQRKQG